MKISWLQILARANNRLLDPVFFFLDQWFRRHGSHVRCHKKCRCSALSEITEVELMALITFSGALVLSQTIRSKAIIERLESLGESELSNRIVSFIG